MGKIVAYKSSLYRPSSLGPDSLHRVHTLGLRHSRSRFRQAGAVNFVYLERLLNKNHTVCVLSLYGDYLRAGSSGDLIPVGARFPHLSRPALGPIQTLIQWVSCLGVKRPGRAVNYLPPSGAKAKERIKLRISLLPLWAFMTFSRANFTFYL